jgi:hypothetical protein
MFSDKRYQREIICLASPPLVKAWRYLIPPWTKLSSEKANVTCLATSVIDMMSDRVNRECTRPDQDTGTGSRIEDIDDNCAANVISFLALCSECHVIN